MMGLAVRRLAIIAITCATGIAARADQPLARNYKVIAAKNAPASTFFAGKEFGPVGIAAPMPSVYTQPGDWAICIKTSKAAQTFYYTLFFTEDKITDWRPSVIIDHCETKQYEPLPKPKQAK